MQATTTIESTVFKVFGMTRLNREHKKDNHGYLRKDNQNMGQTKIT